jgi:hypothetical protein
VHQIRVDQHAHVVGHGALRPVDRLGQLEHQVEQRLPNWVACAGNWAAVLTSMVSAIL